MKNHTMLRSLFAAALLTAAAGCEEPMDKVNFRPETEPPHAVVLSAEQIQIEHGIAIGVTALPVAAGEAIESQLQMSSSDPTIFGVEPVSGNQFIFFGTFPGDAMLRIVEISTSAQVDVPVKVIEQAQ
jgi:hypothetical protein